MTAVYALKFVLVGDSNVGKSQLLRRYTKNEFNADISATVGMEFGSRELPFERCTIKSQIWDTAGQERFEKMTKAFYRDSLGAILVFDVCNKASFDHLKSIWLPQVRTYGHDTMPCILVGNKSDKEGREVELSDAISFAREFKIDYIETSALSGACVDAAFRRIVLSVASLLPAVQTHLELTNLPLGWLCTIEPPSVLAESNSTTASASASASASPSSDATNWNAGGRGKQSITLHSKHPSDRSIVSETPSSSFSNLEPMAPHEEQYCNYWTGELVSKRPVTPAPTLLTYNWAIEQAEREAEQARQLALQQQQQLAQEPPTIEPSTTRKQSRVGNPVQIQQRDSLATKPINHDRCFCAIM